MAPIFARRPQVWLLAFAAAALTACAPSTETAPPSASASTVTVTATPGAAPTAALPPQGEPGAVTVAPPPTVTVTAAPPVPVAPQPVPDGPFQSPSGNIRCAMAQYGAGGHTVRCEVSKHDWVATQPEGCQLNWGDRVAMEEASPARFDCYGQELRPVTHTLQFGQVQRLGPLSCTSEPAGITCIDNNSGHNFFVSRQTVRLG